MLVQRATRPNNHPLTMPLPFVQHDDACSIQVHRPLAETQSPGDAPNRPAALHVASLAGGVTELTDLSGIDILIRLIVSRIRRTLAGDALFGRLSLGGDPLLLPEGQVVVRGSVDHGRAAAESASSSGRHTRSRLGGYGRHLGLEARECVLVRGEWEVSCQASRWQFASTLDRGSRRRRRRQRLFPLAQTLLTHLQLSRQLDQLHLHHFIPLLHLDGCCVLDSSNLSVSLHSLPLTSETSLFGSDLPALSVKFSLLSDDSITAAIKPDLVRDNLGCLLVLLRLELGALSGQLAEVLLQAEENTIERSRGEDVVRRGSVGRSWVFDDARRSRLQTEAVSCRSGNWTRVDARVSRGTTSWRVGRRECPGLERVV